LPYICRRWSTPMSASMRAPRKCLSSRTWVAQSKVHLDFLSL
jgi:hypothetical protein